MATEKLKSLFASYMKGVEDPEACKALAEISSEIDSVENQFTELTTKHDKMKDEYIEALKHTSFQPTEKVEVAGDDSNSFESAMDNLRKELNKDGK
jgi:hypothetical protein